MNPGSFPPGTTAEDFRKRPHSEPINEVISSVFFKSGLMEAWGRGIPDIFNECKAAGLPVPEFESIPNFVCLTIRFKNPLRPYLTGDSDNDRINDKLNDRLNDELNPSVRSTYLLVKDNPGIQRKELSEKTGKSIPTIDRHLAELQEKGFIVHEGSRKTGGYRVK